MTPAARVQSAIEILDQLLAGVPAEQALTSWARRSRFAGSKDRAAVRDHVFDAWRMKRSCAALGGAMSGRGLMLGVLRKANADLGPLFSGEGYGPAPLTDAETVSGHKTASLAEELDIPDWLWSRFEASLGPSADATARALQLRAPVHLRVNLRKATLQEARAALAQDGIQTQLHDVSDTALEVTEGARQVRQSAAYRDGRVELQDAASQAVVNSLPLRDGMRVLDYCAGGGGKALAMAARADLQLFVHDAVPARMQDLPARAERAGVVATRLDSADLSQMAPFDLVLCDAPCSGSGAWRRAPDGKWRLSESQLKSLATAQEGILAAASVLVGSKSVLSYATCSILDEENGERVTQFCRDTAGWAVQLERHWLPGMGCDGFYVAHLTRERMERYTT